MTACLSALSQRAGAVGTGGTALTTPLFSRVAGILIFIYKRAGSPAFITGDGSILWPGEMVDLDWKTRMEAPETNNLKQQSSKLFTDKIPPSYSQVFSPRAAPPAATRAYELYLRLPELSRLWTRRDFPLWKAEPVLKPALQGLEITFRLLSVVLSDPRPYCNQREWATRLESLAFRQVEIIAVLAEDEEAAAGAPVCGLMASEGILSRDRSSSSEVWKIPGATPVVNRTSDASLLARLATWERSEAAASKIQFQIEAQFRRCPFTLGVGEPNLDGKPNLEYDLVCRPAELHALKRTPFAGKGLKNPENKALYNVHQVLESWIFAGRRLVDRVGQRVEARRWNAAAADCWLLERVWKLLAEAEDLHMIMDPDDLLRLRSQLGVSENSGFCLRSATLMELIRASKDLRQLVPHVLGVEVDPDGGPRVQNAAMRLFHRRDAGEEEEAPRVHLLQGFQAVEAAVKRFFFDYRQLVAAVFGSLEASGASRRGGVLAQIFLEPPYFPSLDAAKTFVGVFWQQQLSSAPPETRRPGADDGGGLPPR